MVADLGHKPGRLPADFAAADSRISRSRPLPYRSPAASASVFSDSRRTRLMPHARRKPFGPSCLMRAVNIAKASPLLSIGRWAVVGRGRPAWADAGIWLPGAATRARWSQVKARKYKADRIHIRIHSRHNCDSSGQSSQARDEVGNCQGPLTSSAYNRPRAHHAAGSPAFRSIDFDRSATAGGHFAKPTPFPFRNSASMFTISMSPCPPA